ncbi:cellulase family glycosylhydrolase [Microbacterium paludicola]|uniref:cellulase family glycosylhydrolase n=1 Tax=Microbacterium paludicola TaxID=300019 RepID=UPI003879EFA7
MSPLTDGEAREPAVTEASGRRPSVIAPVTLGALLLVATVVLGSVAWVTGREPIPRELAPRPAPSATPAPEPEAAPAADQPIPVLTAVDATPQQWTRAAEIDLADVDVVAGGAADGQFSLHVHAPRVEKVTDAARVAVSVPGAGTYRLSAAVRSVTAQPAPVEAALDIGEERIELPPLTARWQTVGHEFQVPDGVRSLVLRVSITGAVAGLGIDDLVVHRADDPDVNLVPNPSFESLFTGGGIVNRSLVVPAQGATLALDMARGAAHWRIADARTKRPVAEGRATLGEGATAVPLPDLPQGYFTLTVSDAAGTSASAPIGVLAGADRLAPDGRFGVAAHLLAPTNKGAADAIASLGFGAARHSVTWGVSELSPGVYAFPDELEARFAELGAQETDLLGIVNYGNELYDKGRTPSTAAGVRAFGQYAGYVATHFDLVGLEVFNEFDNLRFNTGECGPAARCYAPLVDAVAKSVRAADPELPIVVGGISTYDGEWFDDLWKRGALDDTDVMSFHPYNAWDSPEKVGSFVADARKGMRAAGAERPVWITELGWTTGDERGDGLDAWQQAAYLVRAQTAALGAGAERLFWYDLVNDTVDPVSHEGNFGLFSQRKTGASALQPKPAAFAQALLIQSIGGRAADGRDDTGAGVWSYRFGEGDPVRIAWSTAGDETVRYPAKGPVRMTRIDGTATTLTPTDGHVTVELTPDPVILSGTSAAQ